MITRELDEAVCDMMILRDQGRHQRIRLQRARESNRAASEVMKTSDSNDRQRLLERGVRMRIFLSLRPYDYIMPWVMRENNGALACKRNL